MNSSVERSILTNVLVAAAAFVIVIAGLRAAAPIVVPFLLAVFIAIITSPILFWLRAKGLPYWLALIIVIFGLGFIGFIFLVLLGSSLSDFSRALPQYQQQLQVLFGKLLNWLEGVGIAVSTAQMREVFDPGAVMRFANNILSGLSGVLSNLVLIGIAAAFILLEASGMAVKMRFATKDPEHHLASINAFMTSVKRYIEIKTIISFFTGLAVAIFLALLGVDFPVLWGLLAFMFNYVPNIGWIIAAVPAILLALLALGPMTAIMAFAGYLVINFILGNIIEPRVMGRGVGLSALVVFVSLVFWGWVLGPVGMILSVPLTMMVKIALQGNEETQWIALLLGTEAEVLNQVPDEDNNPDETA